MKFPFFIINLQKLQVIEMYLQALAKSKYKAHIINTPTTNEILNFNADVLTRVRLIEIKILQFFFKY
jgi:hypothetical protein